jgi:hypothetical protein
MPRPRPPNAGIGRKKGSQNKLTRTVKEAFENVFRDLQKDPKDPAHLREWAKREPDKFYPLAAKLIPTEVKGEMNHTVTPNINCVVEAMANGQGIIVNTEPLGVNGRKPD